MKQTSKYAIVFLAGAIFATAGSAYGAEAVKTISAKLRPDIKVSVNGKQLDASAISYNNTTYLPLRKAAEAVGGKIELNGKDINIVSSTNHDSSTTQSNETTQSEESSTPIENKILYSWKELYLSLSDNKRPLITGGVIDSKIIVYYNDIKYYPHQGTDYYYDPNIDVFYYTEEFLTQFLPNSDLNSLQKYKFFNSVVTPI